MEKWIKISDEQPPLEKEVLITEGKNIVTGRLSEYNKRKFWTTSEGIMGHDTEFTFMDQDVTHWMKLPNLPKE